MINESPRVGPRDAQRPLVSSSSTSTDAACAHCGQALACATDVYCCTGCRAVATLLQSASLDRYYDLRHGRGVRPTLVDETRRDLLWLGAMEDEVRNAKSRAHVTLDVQGMHCAGCVWVIEELFRREAGAQHILVNPGLGRCEMEVEKGFDLAHFVRQVERFGYLFGPKAKQSETAFDSLVLRTGVTVALAMNAMMFGFAQYLGLRAVVGEEALLTTVVVSEVVLAALAVIIGAPPFFKAALEGLRRGILHLDLPIAVGLTFATIGTVIAYVRTGDASFADTLAVFVALMLVGRLIEKSAIERSRHRLLQSLGADGLFARVRLSATSTSIVRASEITKGSQLVIAPHEVVTVDAMAKVAATVSLDWRSGESEPLEIPAGETIPAGAICRGTSLLEAEAQTDFAESGLLGLLATASEAKAAETKTLWHRISGIWVVSVLTLAVLTIVGFALAGQLAVGIANATALLVVTCPCAIGIGTPLAAELAVADLRRAGVLVRRPRTLERLPEVNAVAFDKTGTLTTGELTLRNPEALAQLSADDRAALLALASTSGHPKSDVVRRALARDASLVPAQLDHFEELRGRGLSATRAGKTLRLGHPKFALLGAHDALQDDVDLVFSIDGELAAVLTTDEEIRVDAREEIEALRAHGLAIYILSGDRQARVLRVAKGLGIAADSAFSELTPEDKAAWLLAHGARALFVGDGINDALAADVAFISATPSIERPFLPAKSDFVFSHAGIAPVRWTLETGLRLRKSTRANLIFAALYNTVGAALAIAGVFHPWVAAVLMPLSSLFVVTRTLFAMRAPVETVSHKRVIGSDASHALSTQALRLALKEHA